MCRLSTEPSSGLGFRPLAALMSMSVLGRVTPLAMGPVALVAILMLVCVVGIGKGKSHIGGPARVTVVDAVT